MLHCMTGLSREVILEPQLSDSCTTFQMPLTALCDILGVDRSYPEQRLYYCLLAEYGAL